MSLGTVRQGAKQQAYIITFSVLVNLLRSLEYDSDPEPQGTDPEKLYGPERLMDCIYVFMLVFREVILRLTKKHNPQKN